MCGIIGHVGDRDTLDSLVGGLEKLEYRGYDSAGVAVRNGEGVEVYKCSGEVSELKRSVAGVEASDGVGIGHTRWSTHGPPTRENAHPHTDAGDRIAIVHNGVIENYDELRSDLQDAGYEFTSDTDTEVVPHLMTEFLDRGHDSLSAFRAAVDELDGSYAIAAIVDDDDVIYAAREGSPLVLGIDESGYFVASDVPAFLDHTDRVLYFEDGDTAVVRSDDFDIYDADGDPVERDVERVEWDPDETGKGTYEHYMLKEIHTQPQALSKTLEGRVDDDGQTAARLDELDDMSFDDVESVHFVGCGTSYHAALFGATMLNKLGVQSRAIRASEYEMAANTDDDGVLFVAVTQSGETADTLGAMRRAKEADLRTLAVTNVVQSTAAREADTPLYIRAGPEIGVAATKTFSSQTVALSLLSEYLGREILGDDRQVDSDELLGDIRSLPSVLEELLETSEAQSLARRYIDDESYFFIGRGLACPVAKEGALKFKEITYEHAEGFASGELKHGPLALVTPETPVFAVCVGDDEKTVTNAKEAQARGAPIVAVAPEGHSITDFADEHLEIPDTDDVSGCLLANVQLQLLSYYSATRLGRAIDKPRNLAKSVTVE